MIWMHGLGADAQDMMGLAQQLALTIPVRHVFIDAPIRPVSINNNIPMRAWYDIVGTSLLDRQDRQGILASELMIREVIEQQITQGLLPQQIFLAGFSQGGAMALFTGLRMPSSLGGIISLSAYLPLADDCNSALIIDTPIFLAAGQFDQIVLPQWTQQSQQWLLARGYQDISMQYYPMEHSICFEEIQVLAEWIVSHVNRRNLHGVVVDDCC